MKKIIALVLVAALLVLCCACQSGGDESKAPEQSAAESVGNESSKGEESKGENSKAPDTSKDESSKVEESSKDENSEAGETSDETSSDTPVLTIPENNGMFVCFGPAMASQTAGAYTAKLVGTGAPAAEPNSVMLTGYNCDPVYGSVIVYNADYDGGMLPLEENDWADYAIVVAKYDGSVFNYVLDQYLAVGANDDKAFLEIPEDGFVLVAHKDNKYSAKLAQVESSHIIVPVGTPTAGFEAKIKKASKTPTIDGNVSESEYGKAVWHIDANEKYWAYTDFVKDDYYVNGDVYMTYDENKLYVAVVLSTPYLVCNLDKSEAGSMWKYECIQVNVISVAPDSEYMLQNFDHNVKDTLRTDNIFYQYGFGISSKEGHKGEMLSTIWCGKDTSLIQNSNYEDYCGIRDDAANKTVYEFAISFDSFGNEEHPAKGEKGYEFSFGLSINSTNDTSGWRNVIMRNGGGVIGRNDLAKSAKIILD